jgi:hypothetical protein
VDDLSGLDGFDRLLANLEQEGSGRLSLPGLDEPTRPAEYVRMVLAACRDRGYEFEAAWSAAINRLQPTQLGGDIDRAELTVLREERALIEETRATWRAAYEGRDVTRQERIETIGATFTQMHGPATGQRRRTRGRTET